MDRGRIYADGGGRADMPQPSTRSDRYRSREVRILLSLTAVVTVLHGILIAYQLFLREKSAQTLSLSVAEWVAYTAGPFLVEPILLFGVLYVVGTRFDRVPSPGMLLPGLLASVIVGTILGQFVGEQLFASGWTPLARAEIDVLFRADWPALRYWRDLLEPILRPLLTAVAAIALVKSSAG